MVSGQEEVALAYTILYHPDVKSRDLPKLPANMAARIRRAIEERLAQDAVSYGERLRKDLAGAWKLRVGDYRVVYEIDAAAAEVRILLIAHRKEAYEVAAIRWKRRPPS